MAKETVTLSIDSAVLEMAREQAKKDNRSLSNYVEVLVIKASEKQG